MKSGERSHVTTRKRGWGDTSAEGQGGRECRDMRARTSFTEMAPDLSSSAFLMRSKTSISHFSTLPSPSVSGLREVMGMPPLEASLTSSDIFLMNSKRSRTEMVPLLSVSAATMRS